MSMYRQSGGHCATCFAVNSDSLYQLLPNTSQCNQGGYASFHRALTATTFVIISVAAFIFAAITCYKYNSIKVLNITVRPAAISNTPWILYFFIVSIRSIVGAISYAEDYKLVNIISAGLFKATEVLCLAVALNYQRRYRSGGYFQDELLRFNASTSTVSSQQSIQSSLRSILFMPCELFWSRDLIFVVQFLLSMTFFVLTHVYLSDTCTTLVEVFYCLYIGLYWSLCLSSLVMSVIIAATKTPDEENGITALTKGLFVGGVLVSLTGDIPTYIWQNCIFSGKTFCFAAHSRQWTFTPYNISLFGSIISLSFFLAGLRKEYSRLNQEAQWNVINRVESFYSIAETS